MHRLLQTVIATPDGAFIPGLHATSFATDILPGSPSMVAIVVNAGEALVIDSGYRTVSDYPTGVLDTICRELDRRPGLRVKYILQSHWHFDHTANTQYLKDRYGAEVLCHARERSIIEDPTIAGTRAYVESMGGDADEIAADLGLDDPSSLWMPPDEFEAFFHKYCHFPVQVDRTVEHGERLSVGELELEIVHTPGHSPGHLSLYNPATRSLYLNDVMAPGFTIHPHPLGRVDEQLTSLRRCLALDPVYLYPGHELPRCPEEDARAYLLDMAVRNLQIERRIQVLLSRFGEMTLLELHAETFVVKDRYDFPQGRRFTFSLHSLHGHVSRLRELGRVERVVRADGTVAWDIADTWRLPAADVDVTVGYDRNVDLLDQLDEFLTTATDREVSPT